MIDVKIATRAFSGISFDPEKRAESFIREVEETKERNIAILQEKGVEQSKIDEWIKKLYEHNSSILSTQSGIVSVMITGPAKFPNSRNQKRNDSLHNKYEKYYYWLENSIKRLTKPKKELKEGDITEKQTVILGETVQIIENKPLDRLQIIFDGKPEEETRTQLKKHGFKWSPMNTAWQRQLTENAFKSLKRLETL